MGVVGITGALYAFEREARAAWGERVDWAAGDKPASPRELQRALTAQGLEGAPLRFMWPGDRGEPLWIRWEEPGGGVRELQVDPRDGRVLPRATSLHTFFQKTLEIHRTLAAGKVGSTVTGTCAFVLLALIGSGTCLAIRRGGRGLLGGASRERCHRVRWIRWRYWHRLVGLAASPGLVALALTGPVFTFEWYRELVIHVGDVFSGSAPDAEQGGKNVTSAEPASAAVDLDALWNGVRDYLPGPGRPYRLVLPAGPGKPAIFGWSPEDAPYETFRSVLYLDPGTGAVLAFKPLDGMSGGERLRRWFYPVHTGRVWGWPTRLLAGLAALSLPVLFLGGLYLAIGRGGRKDQERKRVE